MPLRFSSILRPIYRAASAVCLLMLTCFGQAQSVGIGAFAGSSNQISLLVELDAWYTGGSVDSASWFYLYDGNFNCSGAINSLTFSQDKDGTKHSVSQGYGYYYGTGFAIAQVEVDTTTKPDGHSSVAIKIADFFSGNSLYFLNSLDVVRGVAEIDLR